MNKIHFTAPAVKILPLIMDVQRKKPQWKVVERNPTSERAVGQIVGVSGHFS